MQTLRLGDPHLTRLTISIRNLDKNNLVIMISRNSGFAIVYNSYAK